MKTATENYDDLLEQANRLVTGEKIILVRRMIMTAFCLGIDRCEEIRVEVKDYMANLEKEIK